MMTAKENVIRTLRHDNPEWIPVNLWQLPAAKLKYGQALDDIINRCEIDILSAGLFDEYFARGADFVGKTLGVS